MARSNTGSGSEPDFLLSRTFEGKRASTQSQTKTRVGCRSKLTCKWTASEGKVLQMSFQLGDLLLQFVL